MRKYKKWEHRKKFSWKKRMKHVRSGKDVVRDENNNTVHENDNYNIIYRDGYELWPFPYERRDFFDIHTSLGRRGEAYNSDPVIGGIAGPCEPTAIPTVRTGKKSDRKIHKNGSPSRLVTANKVFQEEVPIQVSDIQCSKRTKTIAEDIINISETYDAKYDIHRILTKTQVHVPNVMKIADDSPLRESFASKINENNAAVASGLIPISSIKREAKKGNR